jgi:adenylate cyclase
MSPRLIKAVILGLLTGIVGLMVSVLPFVLDLDEDIGLNILFKLRGVRRVSNDVVVISIDKESAEHLSLNENPDKWPRSIHARLTEILANEGVKVIAFDVHFIEPRSAQDDNRFSEAIGKAGTVVLCEPLKTKEVNFSGRESSRNDLLSIVKIVKPIELFANPAAATAPFPLPRIPFKVNQYWTFQKSAGDVPTLPVVVFQLFTKDAYGEFIGLLEKVKPGSTEKLLKDFDLAVEAKNVKGLMRNVREIFENDLLVAERMLIELKNSKTLANDAKKRHTVRSLIKMYHGSTNRYINFYGPPRTITTIPYYQALQLKGGRIGERRVDLKDKAVFIGLSEALLAERKDSYYTVFSQANGLFISGVEIGATAFTNLMEDGSLTPLPLYLFIPLIIFWGAILGIICRMTTVITSILSVIGLNILYLVFVEYEFKVNASLYPIVIPLFFQAPLAFFGAVVWNYWDTNKERENIKKAFEHYVPKDVVAQLSRNIANLSMGSKIVYGICLFTDAEHYTTLSETMDPAELGRFMNQYYETMFKPVKQNGGFISGVVGDSMLAVWVEASSENTFKDRACMAALDIHRELQRFYESSDTTMLRTRIGVHCGQILLGNVGALDHYEYTPMGDIVNTASRIEGLNKQLGTSLLVSEEVIGQLDGFVTRKLGNFRLVGKMKPVTLHQLISYKSEFDEKAQKACAVFAEALDTYSRQSWDEAADMFQRYIEDFGDDGPSRFYIRQCAKCKADPSMESWGAVVCVEEK